jgi:two-component system sensor histidine kinase BarA
MHLLQDWDLKVTEVEEYERLPETLEQLQAQGPACRLLVLGLGGGLQEAALHRLLQRIRHDGIAILLLANTSDREHMQQLCALGADTCMSKPVRYESLYRELQRLLGHSQPRPKAGKPHTLPQPARLQQLHILLADDNAINRKLLSTQLRQHQATVTEATTGREALELGLQRPFDLILMDIQMPILNGAEVTSRIRHQAGPNRHAPVIALTANAMAGERERLLALGLNECLIKPISEKLLVDTVWRWARHATTRDEARAGNNHREASAVDQDKLLQELRCMLRDELPQHRAALAAAHKDHNLELLCERAHKLNGAAAYCQVSELKERVDRLERLIKQQRLEQVDAALQETLAAIDRLLEAGESGAEPKQGAD